MTSDMLTVPEVAAALRISERTVWRMIATGEIRAGKVRGQRRITTQAFEEYKAAVGLTAPPPTPLRALPPPDAETDEEALGLRLAERQRLR